MSSLSQADMFHPRLGLRRKLGLIFSLSCLAMTLTGMIVLVVLVARVFNDGWHFLSLTFLTHYPSRLSPETAGIKNALMGTLWLIALTAAMSIPIGVGAAIYLHEYAKKNRITRFIELNISNLAGIPSIVYGMLGLAVFVRALGLHRSVLAGALTMSLLILPVIIIASKEALSAVPNSIRLAAYSLGATRWQVVRSHVLPAALPSICTGVILSLSRAIGETAPILMIGVPLFIMSVPSGPLDEFTALPIQIYHWTSSPQTVFHELAASGIIVLLAALLIMNAIAIGIRNCFQRKRIH